MLLVTIIVGFLAILLLVRVIQYKQQIKGINQQMRFIQRHESNLLLSNQFSDKQLNELLTLLNQMLIEQRSNKMTTRMHEQQLKDSITNLAHDIRTPLTSLDGYFQLLIRNKDSQKQQQYIDVINNRIETLTELLETIFTYTKLENDAYKIELQKIETNQVLLNTIFTFYQQFSNEEIEPILSISESPLYILANSAALTRIFSNLIKNSLDHGQGEIKISQTKQGDQVVFTFQNKVSAENELDLSQIFNRFYMSDKSRAGNSTGLGLFIVKEFVEKLNGHIEAVLINQLFTISLTFSIVSDS
ncbi:sensor histidine kinase [Enterococcus crotali]|uniref:sensor histidine kinase n=1 Tax=Enterococcus crotali TaxID=1453587 RepID=UPI0004719462|nr:HAMP domain-containing sensor histidine kinase [Enterococcus crotali]